MKHRLLFTLFVLILPLVHNHADTSEQNAPSHESSSIQAEAE